MQLSCICTHMPSFGKCSQEPLFTWRKTSRNSKTWGRNIWEVVNTVCPTFSFFFQQFSFWRKHNMTLSQSCVTVICTGICLRKTCQWYTCRCIHSKQTIVHSQAGQAIIIKLKCISQWCQRTHTGFEGFSWCEELLVWLMGYGTSIPSWF